MGRGEYPCPYCNEDGEINKDGYYKSTNLKAKCKINYCACFGYFWIKCKECGGSGKYICSYCDSNGYISSTCEVCDGRGTWICPSCNGAKIMNRSCNACDGEGYTETSTCPDCNDKGIVNG